MNNISLYLHFPFCKAKCSYCDFYSLPHLSRKEEYENALCRHISFFGKRYGDRKITTIYLGGGTPSLVSSDGLKRIFDSVYQSFAVEKSAEITMEMNPESALDEILFAAKESGVNRLSFGVQSARDTELDMLGRLHRFSEAEAAVFRAKEKGFSNISLDLMYGLPEQNMSSWQESLEKTVALDVRHLSFYCLTLSPSVPLYREKKRLPDDETCREMYLFAHHYLEQCGFEHYEISNAAKKGYRSRHNEVYWVGGEYLGIGPGAHSLMDNIRFSFEENLDQFISASNPFDRLDSEEPRSKEDLCTEYLMLSLRRKEGFSWKKLRFLSDEAFCSRAEKKLILWEKNGLCHRTEEGYALTAEGFFVSNEIISELI